MSAIDDEAVVLLVEGGLSAKLAAEVFRGIRWGTAERPRDVRHVRDDGFDSIAFSFNLSKEKGHTNSRGT